MTTTEQSLYSPSESQPFDLASIAMQDRWIEIQKNTFQNWLNEQLKATGKCIKNLETDLEDGLVLICLMESLSSNKPIAGGEPLRRRRSTRLHKNPQKRVHKMENVAQALQLAEAEGIKLINIGTEDIIDGNLKLILGLVWRLILKYQINMGKSRVKVPPKKLMLAWIQSVLPTLKIANFSSDWKDGRALSALIEYCEPGLMTHWKSLDPQSALENCRNAMKVAREKFEIPMILSPRDMATEMDELSGMTYLSYYMKRESPGWYATLNWVRSKVPQLNIHNFTTDWNSGKAVCALANAVADLCPEWETLDKLNAKENCDKGISLSRKLGIEPLISGEELSSPDVDDLAVMALAAAYYHSHLKLGSRAEGEKRPRQQPQPLPQAQPSPPPPCLDLSGLTTMAAEGSTHHRTVVQGHTAVFYVSIAGGREADKAGSDISDICVKVVGPADICPATVAQDGAISFTPRETGKHQVSVHYRQTELDDSPFIVFVVKPSVSSAPDKNKINVNPKESAIIGEQAKFQGGHEAYDSALCVARGEGLKIAEVDKQARFSVEKTDDARTKGQLSVQIQGPSTVAMCEVKNDDDRQFTVYYTPLETGIFTIKVKLSGHEIHGSPFHPRVVDPSRIRLKGGLPATADGSNRMVVVVGRTYHLAYSASSKAGPQGLLTAEVVGPSGKKSLDPIPSASDDGTTFPFTPLQEGEHRISAFFWGMPVPQVHCCLARLSAGPVVSSKVRCHGKGLKEARVNELSEFIVDGSQGGPGEPDCHITGLKYGIEVSLAQLGNGIYKGCYLPQFPGAYLLHLYWSGGEVEGSPFKVSVSRAPDASRVVVVGRGIFKEGVLGKSLKAVLDVTNAGPGELSARCLDPKGNKAEVEIMDCLDGTYSLLLKPSEPGKHLLEVKYSNEHITGSPFVVRVLAPAEPSKVRLVGPGLEHGTLSTFNACFVCDLSQAGAGQLRVRIHGPKGGFKVTMSRENQKDRTVLVKYSPTECGIYIIAIKWADFHVTGSPFEVHIVETTDQLSQVIKQHPNATSRITSAEATWEEDI